MEIIARLCIHEPYVCFPALVKCCMRLDVFVTNHKPGSRKNNHTTQTSIRTPYLFLFPLSIRLYQSVVFSQLRSVCPGLLNHRPQTPPIEFLLNAPKSWSSGRCLIKEEGFFLWTLQILLSNRMCRDAGMCKTETLSQPQTDSHMTANWGFCFICENHAKRCWLVAKTFVWSLTETESNKTSNCLWHSVPQIWLGFS